MKQNEHKPVKKILITVGSIAILVLAAVSFIVLPALTPTQKDPLPPLGFYGKQKIEYTQGSYFANAVEYYGQQMKNRGQSIDSSSYFTLLNQAFRDTILTLSFADEVKQSGYQIPDSLADRTMLPYFYDTNGVYSARIFRETPESRKTELRKQVIDQLTYSRYSDDINNLKTAADETEFIAAMDKKQRSFVMVSFEKTNYPKTEAAAYGKNNPELFTKYDLSVITLNAKDKAKNIAQQIKNNELVFSDALSQYSINEYSDVSGKLSKNFHYQLKNIIPSEDALKTIVQLENGSISDVIATSTGYSIFMAQGMPEAADFSNPAVVDAVYEYMTVYEGGIIEEYYMNKAREFTAQALKSGFVSTAAALGLNLIDVPAFSLNYGNSQLLSTIPENTLSQLSGAQTNEKFLTVAFSLEKGEISEPIAMGQNVIILTLQEELNNADASKDNLNFMYPYYVSQFDTAAIQNYFMTSKKVTNNVLNVFFSHFMK